VTPAGVTVCITTHKEPYEILSRAVASVHAQTVQPLEILVIDDGGHMTKEDEQSLDTEGVKVIRITNRGLAAARNTALMLAKGRAFLPLDADDWLDPTYIEKTLPLLTGEVGAVLTGLQEHGPVRNGTYLPGYDMHFNLVTVEHLWTTNRFYYCSLYDTELLREVGGWNPLMAGPWNQGGGYEDWDLWIDFLKRGVKLDAVLEPLLNYSTESTTSMVHRAAQNRDALLSEMKRHHRG